MHCMSRLWKKHTNSKCTNVTCNNARNGDKGGHHSNGDLCETTQSHWPDRSQLALYNGGRQNSDLEPEGWEVTYKPPALAFATSGRDSGLATFSLHNRFCAPTRRHRRKIGASMIACELHLGVDIRCTSRAAYGAPTREHKMKANRRLAWGITPQ
jgi:hypothetical protein